MSFKYYITKNGMYGNQDLQTDKLIFKTEGVIPYIGVGGDFEGPYHTLNELTKNSAFYRELQEAKPGTAAKLILPQNIKTLKKTILVPKGRTFEIDLATFINHTLVAKFKKGGISGLHFFNPENTRILKIYDRNSEGIIDAEIEKLDKESNNWVKKRTTLFPLDWHEGNLIAELDLAYLYRFPIPNKNTHFGGITSQGIKVIFIIVNGKPKSAYPIL